MSKVKTVTLIGEFNAADIRRIKAMMKQIKAEHPRRPDYLVFAITDDDLDRMAPALAQIQRGESSGSAH